jgi:hypothetical protein
MNRVNNRVCRQHVGCVLRTKAYTAINRFYRSSHLCAARSAPYGYVYLKMVCYQNAFAIFSLLLRMTSYRLRAFVVKILLTKLSWMWHYDFERLML